MSYRQLEIWRLAREATIHVHRMTLEALPKFEMYETGSQIRRSVKSIRTNIVEGYGRRRYKQEFIRCLTFAIGSNDETTDHLETLFKTSSLRDEMLFGELHDTLVELGKKLHCFIAAVETGHRT